MPDAGAGGQGCDAGTTPVLQEMQEPALTLEYYRQVIFTGIYMIISILHFLSVMSLWV